MFNNLIFGNIFFDNDNFGFLFNADIYFKVIVLWIHPHINLTELSSSKRIILKANGDLIPNAVAIANIVTENMLKGNSSIHEIKLDSTISEENGQMTSNIEITLLKN